MALKLEVRDRTEGRALRIGTNGWPLDPAPGGPGVVGVASPSSRLHHDTRTSAHTEQWGRGGHAAETQVNGGRPGTHETGCTECAARRGARAKRAG